MVAGPFFSLNIARHKATVRTLEHPFVKTGSPDPAYFATTWPLICLLWQFAQWLGLPLAYPRRHSAVCQWTLPDMPQLADFGGFLYDPARPSQREMPTFAPTIARIANTRQWI
jgi:hypothetical protein